MANGGGFTYGIAVVGGNILNSLTYKYADVTLRQQLFGSISPQLGETLPGSAVYPYYIYPFQFTYYADLGYFDDSGFKYGMKINLPKDSNCKEKKLYYFITNKFPKNTGYEWYYEYQNPDIISAMKGAGMIYMADKQDYLIPALTHETGHEFRLADEYYRPGSDDDAIKPWAEEKLNCDVSQRCDNIKRVMGPSYPQNQCYPGCYRFGSNRSTDMSVMNDHRFASMYSAVDCAIVMNRLYPGGMPWAYNKCVASGKVQQ